MSMVLFPVDAFYKKAPGIVEIILAMTIYQQNLHFYRTDMQSPSHHQINEKVITGHFVANDPEKISNSLFPFSKDYLINPAKIVEGKIVLHAFQLWFLQQKAVESKQVTRLKVWENLIYQR